MRTLKNCLTLLLFLLIFTFATKQASKHIDETETVELGSQLSSFSV